MKDLMNASDFATRYFQGKLTTGTKHGRYDELVAKLNQVQTLKGATTTTFADLQAPLEGVMTVCAGS